MTKYDEIYEIAADNHGLISSAQARQAGVSNNELVQYARRGRITRVGHGLYKLVQWVPEPGDAYAWAVATIGPDAFLYGESVIAMLDLAPTNPNRFFVATPRRVRKKLPENFRVEQAKDSERVMIYDGIPCQSVYDAILSCKDKMLPERLEAAARAAREEGLIDERQFRFLIKKLGGADNGEKAE